MAKSLSGLSGTSCQRLWTDAEAVEVTMVEEGPDDVTAEVKTADGDMGRVIGRRGRVAKAIRTVAQAAADEEGLGAGVEFVD